ncbi:hypothetical protein GCM10010261_18570 [Streptomyces pilosus]|nr:hypothetical protein GCM10010261_18570 [Streptomyces pilosus]
MLHENAYVPAATDDTYTRPMSDPLDTTPCSRPSANSANGTLASFRGRADGTTRAVLDLSQTDNTPLPSMRKGGRPRRTGGTERNLPTTTDNALRAAGRPEGSGAAVAGDCAGGGR